MVIVLGLSLTECQCHPQQGEICVKFYREVLHGVGADGVGVKFPIFAVNCCCLPLSFRRSREKRRKREKRVKKAEKCVKKGENHSEPICTNPVKNLPKFCAFHTVFGVNFCEIFRFGHPNRGEYSMRNISPNIHGKLHDILGRAKRRQFSLRTSAEWLF